MVLLPKSPIRHFQTISPFTGTDKFARHDSGSRAWSGGIKSRSYRHRWWIGRTQTPFPWALLILFDRDQRRYREYTTHGNTHNPLFCPGGNRFTNPVLVWAELVLLGSGRVHNCTVLLAPVQSPQIVPCKKWNWKLEPVNWTSELLSTANQCLTFWSRPFLHGMVSCGFHGCQHDCVLPIHRRCRYERLLIPPDYALEPESWRDQTWSFQWTVRSPQSAESGSSEGEPFARECERPCSNWQWIMKWQNICLTTVP